ncbi:MAG: VOC family protein [Proteobacteria bacterium]|nr:VOC family protein [Pseudomonadota bacterium]
MIKLDHIGFVVDDIAIYVELFRALGLTEATDPVEHPSQRTSASFINVGKEDDVYIEVLEPTHEISPVTNFLKKSGGGLHHLCFEVDDIGKISKDLVEKGFKMVNPPEDCAAYDKNLKRECKGVSRIAFFILGDVLLVELIEKGV